MRKTPTRTSTRSTSSCPRLTRRFNREYKDLDALDPANFGNPTLPLKPFTPEETREIVFKTMLDAEVAPHHPARRRRPRRLPLGRRLLRAAILEGDAPRRWLRRCFIGKVKAFLRRAPVRGLPGGSRRSGGAAQPLRARSREDPVRLVQEGHQRADRPGERLARASKTVSVCATRAPFAPRTGLTSRRGSRCSARSSASRMPAASSSRSPAFSTPLRTSPPSPRTISLSASRSTTSRPTAISRTMSPTSS